MTVYNIYAMKTIYFDMDGTLDDLFSVDNWRIKLDSGDVTPYELAKPLLDLDKLSLLLINLQQQGNKVGIITWGSKCSTEDFAEKVKLAKIHWIKVNMPNVNFDEFVMMDYSCNKASSVKDPFGILFDDSAFVRKSWPGEAYSPEYIFPILEKMIEEGNKIEGI